VKALRFADENGKKLMVVLFDPSRPLDALRQGERRHDQEIVDYLAAERYNVFDMNEVYLRDYRHTGLPYGDYLKPFFIGHHDPRGNHFVAYSIKGKVVEWLDPSPITYRHADTDPVDFRGYLPTRPDGRLGAEGGAGPSSSSKRP
jgi:hypothetical protein